MEQSNICQQFKIDYPVANSCREKEENMRIIKIEKHLYENKNHTVREEYRVFRENNAFMYRVKTRSELTKKEKETFKETGKTIFHF